MEVRPDLGPENCLVKVARYPDYGTGRDGWREAFSLAGNGKARLGVGGYRKEGLGSLFVFLLDRARGLPADASWDLFLDSRS